MSTPKVILGRDLRLMRRAPSDYWVRIEPSMRTLGAVWKHRSRWHWSPSPNAFRGDGRPDHACDGDPTDYVPADLLAVGDALRQDDACEMLIEHLNEHKAPVLGHGPHPRVRAKALVSVQGGANHGW